MDMSVPRTGASDHDLVDGKGAPGSESASQDEVRAFESEKPDDIGHAHPGAIPELPTEIMTQIVRDVPPRYLHGVAATNKLLRAIATEDPQVKPLYYGQAVAARQTAQRLLNEGYAGSEKELYGKVMSAIEAAHQLRSDGALDPEHPDIHRTLRQLGPHFPYFPRPEDVPAHSRGNVTRAITSADIDAIVMGALNGPNNDVNAQNLQFLFGISHDLSPELRADVFARSQLG
jgi:hypothetical protein